MSFQQEKTMNISLALQYWTLKKPFFGQKKTKEWCTPFYFLDIFYKLLPIFNDFSITSLIFLTFSQVITVSDYGFYELKRFLFRKELNFLKNESRFLFSTTSNYKNFSFWYNCKWLNKKEKFFFSFFPVKRVREIYSGDPKNLHFQSFLHFILFEGKFLLWEKLTWIEILTLTDFFGKSTWILRFKLFLRSEIISSDGLNFLSNKNLNGFSQIVPNFIEKNLNYLKIKNGFSVFGLEMLFFEIKKKKVLNT